MAIDTGRESRRVSAGPDLRNPGGPRERALSRYDQRKNYEEANAISTEYVRADLLPAADTARVRALLRNYLDQRILTNLLSPAARIASSCNRMASRSRPSMRAISAKTSVCLSPKVGG